MELNFHERAFDIKWSKNDPFWFRAKAPDSCCMICLADRPRWSWDILTYGPLLARLLQLCSHCSRINREPHFPIAEGFSFLKKKKSMQRFLSQNNLSLFLTRLSAIFTQLKSQMIYFQLHYSPALWHMVPSITLESRALPKRNPQTDREIWKESG